MKVDSIPHYRLIPGKAIHRPFPSVTRFNGSEKTTPPPSSGGPKKRILPALVMTLPLIGAGAAAAQHGGNPYVNQPHDYAPRTVNHPDQLPRHIDQHSTQLTYDILPNWLHPETREHVENEFRSLANARIAYWKLLVIEHSDEQDMEGLNLGILNNRLKLGTPEYQNGGLFVVVADRMENNLPGKLSFQPGTDIEAAFPMEFQRKLMVDLVQNVHINRAMDARSRGDKAEMKYHLNVAIREAVTGYANQMRKMHDEVRPRTPEEIQAQKETAWRLTKYTALFIGALGLLAAGGFFYRRYQQEKARLAAAVSTIKKPLATMKSPYPVDAKNAFTIATLETLLGPSNVEVTNPKQHAEDLIAAIQTVLDNTTADKEQITAVVLERGLTHPLPGVRIKTVRTVEDCGLDRTDFAPLMALLKTEEDDDVVDALVKPIRQLATREDVPMFQDLLAKSDEPGVRALSIEVLDKYASSNPHVVREFMAALAKETEGKLVEKLEKAIAKHASNGDAPMLLANLDPKSKVSLRLKSASLNGLAAIAQKGNKEYFDEVWDLYRRNTTRKLDEKYVLALQASVSDDRLPMLFEGLSNPQARVQKTAITLLHRLASPMAVAPLLEYLESKDTRFPDEATEALVASVKDESRSVLLATIDSYDPKTEDHEAMNAALQGIKKLGHPDDLDNLVEALERTTAPHIQEVLVQAMEKSRHTRQSFEFLADMLKHKDEKVRIAAALTIDDYVGESLIPLMDALARTTGKSSAQEVDTLTRAILKAGREEDKFDYLLARSLDSHPRVSEVAGTAAANQIDTWEQEKTYDTPGVMTRLSSLKDHGNPQVAKQAKRTHQVLVKAKVDDIQEIGSSGKYLGREGRRNFETLKDLSRNAAENKVRQAAKEALRELKQRLADYEERERIRREREAAEAAARALREAMLAAQRAARRNTTTPSWPSSRPTTRFPGGGFGGGFGGGGGGGRGGGFSI